MNYNGISILGSNKFIEQTVKALRLIKKKSKTDYNTITKYLKKIKSAKSSKMILDKAQFNVGEPTAFGYYLEWYASTIVHDVHHFYLHSTGRLLWKRGNFKKHEELCVSEQLRFLKKIRAPKQVIDHCRNVLKTKYWHRKKRSW